MAIRIPSPTRPSRGLDAPVFWSLALACLLFSYLSLDNRFLRDYWQHLASARAALEAGEWLPARDRLAFTLAGQAYVNSDWLAQHLLLAAHQAGGLALARTLNALLVLLAFTALGWSARARAQAALGGALEAAPAGAGEALRSASWRGGRAALAATGAALACALQSLTLRPQTFSLLLACGALAILEASRRGPRWRWGLPPLMALWANLHGAFPLGWALIFLDNLEHRRKSAGAPSAEHGAGAGAPAPLGAGALAADLLTLLAPLAHPQGRDLLQHLLLNAQRSRARGISEWAGPALASPAGLALLLAAAGTLALWWLGGRLPGARAARVLVLGIPAVLAARMVAWFGVGMAPAWAELAARLPSRRAAVAPERAVPASLLAMPVLMVALCLPWGREGARWLPEERRPLERGAALAAVDWLAAARASGNVWAPFDWAGYVEWKLFGRARLFADGRVALFPDPVWRDYERIEAGEADSPAILEEAGVGWVVVDRSRSPRLEQLLVASGDWKVSYQDPRAAVLARRSGGQSPP